MATAPIAPIAPTGQELAQDAVASSVRVIESAVTLARAEAKLFVLRARTMLVQAVTLGAGVMVAVTFFELSLILAALSPLVLGGRGGVTPLPFIICLGISLALTVGGAAAALVAWKRFSADGSDES